jgi:4-hydroxy-3-methylbut-2-enyl diphosphate reductase
LPREIILADAAGFCSGVKKAIDKAESMEQAFIFGSLIHNPQEVARLAASGKRIVRSLEEIHGKQVVITAHGLDVQIMDSMRREGFELLDTTCPLVTRIYKEGWKLESQGYRIIIIGDPHHVEVKGIASRMKDPLILYRPEDVEQVPPGSKVGVICQSTLLMEKFDASVESLK